MQYLLYLEVFLNSPSFFFQFLFLFSILKDFFKFMMNFVYSYLRLRHYIPYTWVELLNGWASLGGDRRQPFLSCTEPQIPVSIGLGGEGWLVSQQKRILLAFLLAPVWEHTPGLLG